MLSHNSRSNPNHRGGTTNLKEKSNTTTPAITGVYIIDGRTGEAKIESDATLSSGRSQSQHKTRSLRSDDVVDKSRAMTYKAERLNGNMRVPVRVSA